MVIYIITIIYKLLLQPISDSLLVSCVLGVVARMVMGTTNQGYPGVAGGRALPFTPAVRWDMSPSGQRSVGINHPLLLWNCQCMLEYHLGHPNRPAAQEGLLPPQSRGRAVIGDRPGWLCQVGFHPDAGDAFPCTVSKENHTLGEWLTGRGTGRPQPLSPRVTQTLSSLDADHPHRPARSAPPPAPFRGGGQ